MEWQDPFRSLCFLFLCFLSICLFRECRRMAEGVGGDTDGGAVEVEEDEGAGRF